MYCCDNWAKPERRHPDRCCPDWWEVCCPRVCFVWDPCRCCWVPVWINAC